MPTPDAPTPALSGPRRLLRWFVRDSRTGRLALVQAPNPALGVWALTAACPWVGLFADHAAEVRWIGAGALIAWAADEVLRGASPARRLLGAVVLGWQLHRLTR